MSLSDVMKKVLLLTLLILFPMTLISQKSVQGFTMGVNLGNWIGDDNLFADELASGINIAMGSTDFTFTSTTRIGFSMGMFLDYRLGKSLSVQPELLYSQKGAKFSGTGTVEFDGDYYSSEEDLIVQLDYIDLVLLAKYAFGKGNIRPYVVAGPGVGYLVTSKMKAIATVEGETDTESSKAEGFREFDTYVNAGAGLDFAKSLRIEFRYYYFFNTVSSEDSYEAFTIYNSVKAINLVAYF
jgi:hypothetical protein